jgi:hypothetical protein
VGSSSGRSCSRLYSWCYDATFALLLLRLDNVVKEWSSMDRMARLELVFILIIIIIIIIINCNWVFTRWQWLIYMYTIAAKFTLGGPHEKHVVAFSIYM